MKVVNKLLVVLHNVYSVQRVVELAKVVYGLGFNTLIVSRAHGAAAQSGVPEAQKIALRKSKNFFYVSDLADVIEIFNPALLLLFVPKDYAEEKFDVVRVVSLLRKGEVIALVFGGAEPGLSKKELEMGKPTYIEGVEEDIGSTGLAAIALYMLRRASKE